SVRTVVVSPSTRSDPHQERTLALCSDGRSHRGGDPMLSKLRFVPRRLAAFVVPIVITFGVLAIGVNPASATVTLGPDGRGFTWGTAACDSYSHELNLGYYGTPQFGYDGGGLNGISFSMPAVPEWVDVFAYARPVG